MAAWLGIGAQWQKDTLRDDGDHIVMEQGLKMEAAREQVDTGGESTLCSCIVCAAGESQNTTVTWSHGKGGAGDLVIMGPCPGAAGSMGRSPDPAKSS